MENKNSLRSKIPEARFRQPVRCSPLTWTLAKQPPSPASIATQPTAIFTSSGSGSLHLCEQESPFSGEVEVDEPYFGGRRIKGKRGRGAAGKAPVFGIFQRSGKVYTEVVPNCAKATLQAIIRGNVELDSIVHSDG